MDSRTDEQLVTAHLGGEREALAGIYDRYADALHDTAVAMLRDRHDASDAVQDVFLITAERLSQLRDPTRLKPWLFAILRNEVYRRSRRRRRDRPTDVSELPDVADIADPGDQAAAAIDHDALAASLRAAAAGLDARDQLVLELTVRRGLAGPDLAAALGVSVGQSHVLVHRMRQRVERSLGALAVARTGRKHCPDLERILAGWDGTFNVLVRKRVARHVDSCATCGATKRRYAALPLLAAAPAFAAPPRLREHVLDQTAVTGALVDSPYDFTADGGFPTMARIARRGGALLVAAAAAVVLVLGAGAAVVLSRGGGDDDAAAPTGPTGAATAAGTTAESTTTDVSTGTAASTTTTTTPPTTTTAPSVMAASTTTTATSPPTSTPSPPPAPGFVELSSERIDLGADAESARLTMRNTGGTPIDWVLEGDLAPFTWTSDAAPLGPGEADSVELGLDRSQLAEGTINRVLTVTPDGGGGGPVEVTARVERAPVIGRLSAPARISCPWSVPPIVSATVSDESALSSVELEWRGPGSSGAASMGSSGGSWNGRLDIAAIDGTWSYVVTAADERGNTGTASGTLVVDSC